MTTSAPDPVERTVRYATSVDTLTEAWAFVMEHLDAVGDQPHIEVKPFTTAAMSDLIDGGGDPSLWRTRFGVVVSGMTVQEATAST